MSTISDGEAASSVRGKLNTSLAVTDAINNTGSGEIITAAERVKLTAIEASADVTDATNVAAAGAVMDSDFSEPTGLMHKDSAGTYHAIKTNFTATTNPGVNDDTTSDYSVGSKWLNTSTNVAYECVDATNGAAVWSATSGGLSDLVDDTTPQLGGNLDLNSNTVGDATAADLTKLNSVTATATELNYTDGVTSNIQTQIDTKQATITNSDDITEGSTNLFLTSAQQTKLNSTTATSTELNYSTGVTSALQTQIDGKLPLTGGTLTAKITVQNAVPVYQLNDTSGATDEKKTNISSNNGALRIQNLNDADAGGGDFVEFTRSGNNMVAMVFYDDGAAKTTLNNNGTISITGTITTNEVTYTGTDGTAGQVLVTAGDGTTSFTTINDTTKLPLAGGTLTGDIAMGTNDITGAGYVAAKSHRVTQQGLTSGTSIAWNLDDGALAKLELSHAVTTFQIEGTDGQTGVLEIINQGTNTITGWAAGSGSLYWQGGTAPTITSGAGKRDLLTVTLQGGNVYVVQTPNFS